MEFTACIYHGAEKTCVRYPEGTRLSEILAGAGLVRSHPCGGHGKCGKCAVKVEGAVDAMTDTECEALARAGYPTDGTYRVSCLATMQGDLTLY